MSITMYHASIPVVIHNLQALKTIIGKAARAFSDQKADEKEWLAARLAPDMFSLLEQFRFLLLHAKLMAVKLADIEVPALADNEGREDTLQEIAANIELTLAFLRTIRAEQIDGRERASVELVNFSNETLRFTGEKFLLGFALPNFFFHYSMAYAILRNRGLQIGKHDFLGVG